MAVPSGAQVFGEKKKKEAKKPSEVTNKKKKCLIHEPRKSFSPTLLVGVRIKEI